SARAVRFSKSIREQRAGEMQELEKALDNARLKLETATQQLILLGVRGKSLDSIEDLVLRELEQDTAWNRDARTEAAACLDRNSQDLVVAHSEQAALTVTMEEC